MLTLAGLLPSPSVRKVYIVLAEKNVAFRTFGINFQKVDRHTFQTLEHILQGEHIYVDHGVASSKASVHGPQRREARRLGKNNHFGRADACAGSGADIPVSWA